MGCWCSTAAEGGVAEKRPTQVAKEGKKDRYAEGKKHGDKIVKDGNKIVISFDQKYAGRIIGKKGATVSYRFLSQCFLVEFVHISIPICLPK